MDKQDEIISLLKEQNKRLAALQRIEADNNSYLGAINAGGWTISNSVNVWGHHSDSDSNDY